MFINATVSSITAKAIVIGSKDDESGFVRVIEIVTPYAFKNFEVPAGLDTLEIRCAYKGQKWGLKP